MPTVLFLSGWRFFFYSNENGEPIHIHCQKAEKECKFWLYPNEYEIELSYNYNLNSKDIRFLRKTIFLHFDYLVEQWESIHGGRE